ncbi:hypothetical protein MMR93_25990, partial [Escherichia coli]|nr:hypothetical protein [Escherichia coli]
SFMKDSGDSGSTVMLTTVFSCGDFCWSHPLTHFVLPCQQLASAVKLFMQQTCTSPQWLAYFS